MKYCEKCKKTFSDEHVFCAECGSKLVDAGGGGDSNANLIGWLPVVLAAIGAFIGWNYSALVGLLLGVAGVGIILQRKKQGQVEQVPFILTWVLAGVDLIFWFITLAA